MFKRQSLGGTVIEFPQSAGLNLASGSHIIYIFQEGVIEQCLPPDRYGSLFHNVSNPWILELVDVSRLLSFFSLFGLPRIGISTSRCALLLGTLSA